MLREHFEAPGDVFFDLLCVAAPIGIFIWLVNQPWFLDFISTHFV